MRALIFVAIACTAGCLRQTEFKCATDTDCSTGGAVCQASGYCSFTDSDCPSGQRYGDYAGSNSGQCVDDSMPMVDGGVDMMIDAFSTGNCPTTYRPLPNAGPNLYRLTTNAQMWGTQRDRCMSDGAYLAIPDNTAELQAITTAAAAARTWVGITDSQNEGTYVTVRGGAATFLPWGSGEPDNPGGAGGEDCVTALMSSPTIATDRCSISFPAICECEP
jgi:hypothetical protein